MKCSLLVNLLKTVQETLRPARRSGVCAVFTLGFCGAVDFLLPLQEFAGGLGGVSATLSLPQHFCVASPDAVSAACPVQSLLHGKTRRPAPPAVLTPPKPPTSPQPPAPTLPPP